MATEINKATEKISVPSMTLVGQRVNDVDFIGGTGTYGGGDNTEVLSTTEIVVDSDNLTVTKRDPLVFFGDVVVTITADADFSSNSYSNRESTDFVGETAPVDNKVAKYAETYYTTNGKSPKRTKSNLYTGSFTIRRNLSGVDNIIIKARTYCNGTWSEVQKVEFSIIRETSTNV